MIKPAHGMTVAKSDSLHAIGQDQELKHQVNFLSLLNFSQIYVRHARDLAKAGQKDDARNWLRFFQNSKLVEILAYQTSTVIPAGDLKKLSDDLKLLNGECHPLDVPDWAIDIQAIRAQLDYIIENLPVKKNSLARVVGGLKPVRFSLPALNLPAKNWKTVRSPKVSRALFGSLPVLNLPVKNRTTVRSPWVVNPRVSPLLAQWPLKERDLMINPRVLLQRHANRVPSVAPLPCQTPLRTRSQNKNLTTDKL